MADIGVVGKPGKRLFPAARWWVLLLLFLSTIINYMDRIVLSVLVPVIRDEMHFSEKVYGYITAAFQIAYTIGALVCGPLLDSFGTKIAMGLAVGVWSMAAMLHASALTPLQLGAWRGLLGFAEAGNFPAANKSAAEWFPSHERGFAVGIFTSGANIAAVAGPPVFVALQQAFGWRVCFAVTGAMGFAWLLAWLAYYRVPSEPATPSSSKQISFRQTLAYPQAWGYSIGKFLTDPVWWFYLFWLPLYLHDVRKLNMVQLGWVLPFIYLVSDFGAVAGGWFSGYLIRRGWPVGKARKTTMLICVVIMPFAALGVLVDNITYAVILFSLATGAHQAWMTNLFTSVSDVFPQNAVGRVYGSGGAWGGLGGVIGSALIPGYLIGLIGYTPLFISMSLIYVVAFLAVHKLMGPISPIGEA